MPCTVLAKAAELSFRKRVERLRDRSGQARAQPLPQHHQVLRVAGGKRGIERARGGRVEMGGRVYIRGKRRALQLVGKSEETGLALDPGEIELFRFRFRFAAQPPDRLGQGIDVFLLLSPQHSPGGALGAPQQPPAASVGVECRQLAREGGVQDADIGPLFRVGIRAVTALAAATRRDEDRDEGKCQDEGGAAAAAPPIEATC